MNKELQIADRLELRDLLVRGFSATFLVVLAFLALSAI